MIKREDVDRALQALTDVGMRAEDPPEEWLVKAWDGNVLVDLIFWPKGLPIDDAVIARGEELAVLSMSMRVMALEDVLITKLMALSEHHLRYEGVLAIARALRERVDWSMCGPRPPARRSPARSSSSPRGSASSRRERSTGIRFVARTAGGVVTDAGSAAAAVG